ncbi:esterase 6-like [Contarinia nasturtii]|uniref:esterase 6-like n=1 Tax=Contarinia nasturtii TaxID=265458 RepID=UPI0012D38124|nr:esterase 6-like [Contarinia nasturtii]
MLSTESRKYFHNAIAMSGVIGNYWAMSEHNDHLDIAHKIAGDLDEPKNSYEDLLAFLKSAPADKISEYSKILLPNAVAVIQFTPVVERRDAIQPFLVESPEKVYETQNFDFDVLFTTTSVEFAGMISAVPPLKDINNDFNLQLPFRGLQLAIGSDNYRNLTAEIFKFYFGDNEQTERSLKQYITLLTHLNFQYEIDKVVQKHAIKSKSKTFYAWFSVDSKLNVQKPRDPSVADIHGASHADDLFYLFKSNSIQSLYDEVVSNQNDEHSKISLQAIDNITKIFTNFAKYGEISHKGDPISELKPVKNGDVHFLNIKNDGLEAGPRPNKEAFDFLASIEEKTRKLSDDLLKQKRDEL